MPMLIRRTLSRQLKFPGPAEKPGAIAYEAGRRIRNPMGLILGAVRRGHAQVARPDSGPVEVTRLSGRGLKGDLSGFSAGSAGCGRAPSCAVPTVPRVRW